jgi:3-oxoacyl-[acyl-carrier protein] reductase
MLLDLSGKRALVTGSSRGIGFAIAAALHAEGCRVALNGRDSVLLSESAQKLKGSIAIAGDFTLTVDAAKIVSNVVDVFGGLDILVCNIGGGQSVPPGSETIEEWHRVFSLNFWSTINAIEAARAALTYSHGSIVCISSICGVEMIPEAPITYSTAKAALHSYVKGISRPLGKQGVRINAIAPGNILFNGSAWERRLLEDEGAIRSMLDKNVALSSFGTPQDIAGLTVFLASESAKFATGGIWVLDGGQVHSR